MYTATGAITTAPPASQTFTGVYHFSLRSFPYLKLCEPWSWRDPLDGLGAAGNTCTGHGVHGS